VEAGAICLLVQIVPPQFTLLTQLAQPPQFTLLTQLAKPPQFTLLTQLAQPPQFTLLTQLAQHTCRGAKGMTNRSAEGCVG
jgi:hypothetical protein